TTTPASTRNCGNVASPATSHDEEPATRSPRDAGSSNKPSPCSTNSVAWPSDGNAAPTSTTDSSTSPQPSSAGDDSATEPDRGSYTHPQHCTAHRATARPHAACE